MLGMTKFRQVWPSRYFEPILQERGTLITCRYITTDVALMEDKGLHKDTKIWDFDDVHRQKPN